MVKRSYANSANSLSLISVGIENDTLIREVFSSNILKNSFKPSSWYSLNEIDKVSRQQFEAKDFESLIRPESSITLLEISNFSKAILQIIPSFI